jgi:hypothetical protein
MENVIAVIGETAADRSLTSIDLEDEFLMFGVLLLSSENASIEEANEEEV